MYGNEASVRHIFTLPVVHNTRFHVQSSRFLLTRNRCSVFLAPFFRLLPSNSPFFFFFFLMIFYIYTIVIFDVKSSNLSSYSCFVYKFLGHRSGAVSLFFSKTILSAPILDYFRFHSRGLLNLPRSRYSRYSRTISEER